MQDPQILKRDQGLKKVQEGIQQYNQNKGNYYPMQEGYQKMIQGIELLVSYVKLETNQEVVKLVNQKLNEFFSQAESMKLEIRAIQPQQQQNNNNQNQQPSQIPNQNNYNNNTNNNNNQNQNQGGNNSQENSNLKQSGLKDGDEENSKLKEGLMQAIVTEKPNVKWEDVAGLENAKKALQEAVILPIKFPQIFDGVRQPWKGILLYGPPGTGKTFLAKACATECEATFFSISSADLISKYVGESEKLIKNLFKMAREKKPSIIFIDEVDSMTGNREGGGGNEASQRVKTQFLIEMQGVGNDDRGVLVLGATNIPWGLDPAIRRRFEKRIYICLPEPVARIALLKNLLAKTKTSLTDDEIQYIGGQATEGFSGADMSILVRDASYEPLRKCERATKYKRITTPEGKQAWTPCAPSDPQGEPKRLYDLSGDELYLPPVEVDDFMTVLGKIKPSVSPADIVNHVDWTKQFGQEG
ncbi:P-loop containing nucleoside triphosphate hydrolase [Pseudocohnilembus persalinus]|uniref:p-loop containing nucleoside triphosphate hydrolase n=1 Tax=Pseudocohnilembus persalinus TaxID=266149 RepID=A0A0V0QE31_PSEPJ|nr:P-loop containing nucleoside triphosphate hydrolase [Pseudocohnilembus persalinus]|eukprot:KRX00447.1 P-loop containing nucleoside triphosphate hydrolase [Pseudocohnilembus persalinus]